MNHARGRRHTHTGFWWENLRERDNLVNLGGRWEDNITMRLQELLWDRELDWFAENSDKRLTAMEVGMMIWFPQNAGKFLTTWGNICFERILCSVVLISQVRKSEAVSSFSRTVSRLFVLYVWRHNILCVCLSICVVVVAECCSISKMGHHGETRRMLHDRHNEETDTAVRSVGDVSDVFRSLITSHTCRRAVSLNKIFLRSSSRNLGDIPNDLRKITQFPTCLRVPLLKLTPNPKFL
jgi:hypothetical protein